LRAGARRIYDVFVSGGRDSTAAAVLACREAEELGVPRRLVFIDEFRAFKVPEGSVPYSPLDYVRELSKYLGVELLVLDPGFDFWEGVKRWGYPNLKRHRWCFRLLKKGPLLRLAEEESSRGVVPVWVTGIRRGESYHRAEKYRLKRYYHRFGGHLVEYYHPILDWSDEQVDSFLREELEKGLPRNPLWDLGFSCECFCFAGTSRRQLDKIIASMPGLAKWLAERDKEVQAVRRRRDPACVRPLYKLGKALHEYVEERLRQRSIQDFVGRAT